MRHRGPPAVARHRARASEERSLTDPPEPRFLGSFPRADVPLDPPLPAVAFVGRSNVGKSTLLNALLGRRIAKTSGTPGKTRMMNVYHVSLGRREKGEGPPGTAPGIGAERRVRLPSPVSLYFLDLPGYGYARAGKAERAGFRRLVTAALARDGLAGVVWLLDLRREPSADDLAIQDLLAARGSGVLAAFTKSDKLPRGRRLTRERALTAALGLDADQVIATSAVSGDGIAELHDAILGLLEEVA